LEEWSCPQTQIFHVSKLRLSSSALCAPSWPRVFTKFVIFRGFFHYLTRFYTQFYIYLQH
jgi:hypothetical protein